ncbi:DUF599 domain-containing protein [Mangrovicella endophytica]|uniref:DUF599 domain-containing protein n=1 Tax=Mangrovicella endophytica TaxID=2066697 RepID=UPI000C9DC830|nr:DUF599 family protein [Mangrovicella endophytica]
MSIFGLTDAAALGFFLAAWISYSWVTDHSSLARHGLSRAMNEQRRRWLNVMQARDLRMIDTAILTGLQQGTAFFASACIFAIGGCFALLGSADRIAAIASDLPITGGFNRMLVETKLLGLVVIFAFSFFKFGWSYRLFNYCSILLGAVPMRGDPAYTPKESAAALERTVRMNQLAAAHFNAGLRAIFFGLAYLGWFLGPAILGVTTVLVVAILSHRQFFSAAQRAVSGSGGRPS